MPRKPTINLFKVYENSPLDRVNQVLLSGEFVPSPQTPIGENETVLEELSLFEKAVLTAQKKTAEIHNAIVRASISTRAKAMREGKKIDAAKEKEDKRLANLEENIYNALGVLLSTSIMQRLSKPNLMYHDVTIKEGYKIVQVPPRPPAVQIIMGGEDPLSSLLSGMRTHGCHDN